MECRYKKLILISLFILLYVCKIPLNIMGSRLTTSTTSLEQLAEQGIVLAKDNVNKYNKSGYKNGLWIEDNEICIKIINYLSDKKNGMEMIFYKYKSSLKLSSMLRYSNGELRSITIIDEKSGLISGLVDNITTNDESINYPIDWNPGCNFPYIGYSTYFNSTDGRIYAEGYEVFGEDWEMDCERVGEWKIYDKEGNYVVKNYGGLGINKSSTCTP